MVSLACCLTGVSLAAESDLDPQVAHAQMVFFETKVRPLLAEHCWSCHGPEKQNGDLRLDTYAGLIHGGESGSSIDRESLDESLLLQAVRYESYEMPPAGKLKDDDIEILERWVAIGAPWPGATEDAGDVPATRARDTFTDEDRDWWAFRPLTRPEPPTLDDTTGDAPESWRNNPIDAFLLRSMADAGLTPAPEADRVALLRRVCFDLVGLPPTPEQVASFLDDDSPEAYSRLVDELLDSPRYGERWARHWLDLVRYADSDGYRADHYRPHAWRYRDYVIESLNEDKPYDRFVQEQLAGDELFPGDPQALVATGFLRHWIYEYNARDAPGQWRTILEDVTDTAGDVFLGFGLQCAKCHDHKFDPITQRDYFRLQAFFAPIMPADLPVLSPGDKAEYEDRTAEWETATQAIREELETILDRYRPSAVKSGVGKFPLDIQEMYHRPVDEQSPGEKQLVYLVERQVEFEYERLDAKLKPEDKERVLELRRQLAEFDKIKPAPAPIAQTVHDVGPEAPETRMPKRSKEPIAPGFLSILDPTDVEIAPVPDQPSTGRRATLARWLTQPDNPLTSRVITNRIWQHHFGRGLAPNSSDFGKMGGEPTHPELLDYLATRFVDEGWSIKSLHRLICNSAAYRQSTAHPQFDDFQLVDPANRYYWRAGTRRLDAEQIRDAVLAVSGKLNLEMGGDGGRFDSTRRTIYTRVMRNDRDPLLDVFDLPAFFASESSRNTTTTPVQSLMLLNSPQLIQHAETLANRLGDPTGDLAAAIDRLWLLAYARTPEPAEREAALSFLASQVEVIRQLEGESNSSDIVIGKMGYRDGQSISIMPDEKPTPMAVQHRPELEVSDFTLETFMEPRSVYPSGAVRTLMAKWEAKSGARGWSFGITGKGSRRKPQTLVLQMWGEKIDGSVGEAALFSDHHLDMNKPYYVSAAVTLAKPAAADGSPATPGSVQFYVKDLSDEEEPLLVATVEHTIVGGLENDTPLFIGSRGDKAALFDGLIDSVRVSRTALSTDELLLSGEKAGPSTLGYWRFEIDPGVRRDSSTNALDLVDSQQASIASQPLRGALIDLCHAILNSNEFLYLP
ncbi:MAG: DUF1549 domain-containing protein [Planctomycetaceae bacterium]|nr:MAG: DUF1549 domain-containing protein [Planctomycetaceae bacterium]